MAKVVTLNDEQIRAAIMKAHEADGKITSLDLTTVSNGPLAKVHYKLDGVESAEEGLSQAQIITCLIAYLRDLKCQVNDNAQTTYEAYDGGWRARVEVVKFPS
jgi:hypothetical protein